MKEDLLKGNGGEGVGSWCGHWHCAAKAPEHMGLPMVSGALTPSTGGLLTWQAGCQHPGNQDDG